MDLQSIIVFRSDDFWLLNKAPGVSVHNEAPSLAQLLSSQGQFHFVNRLDRETSGLVLATQKPEMVKTLSEQMSHQKIYRGIVSRPRNWEKSNPGDSWVWQDPITDTSEGRKNPAGLKAQRVKAETRVTVVASQPYYLDLEFHLITGRQHQIRKHCALHQMPLVNDHRYGRETLNKKAFEVYQVSRMMLHAWKLKLTLSEVLSFEAPLPAEFAQLMTSTPPVNPSIKKN